MSALALSDRTEDQTPMLGKSMAILFLAAVMLVPVAIVARWHHMGAVWVIGYVVGMITTPFIGFGALRATNELFEGEKAFIAFVIFGFAVVVISLAAAAYSFAR